MSILCYYKESFEIILVDLPFLGFVIQVGRNFILESNKTPYWEKLANSGFGHLFCSFLSVSPKINVHVEFLRCSCRQNDGGIKKYFRYPYLYQRDRLRHKYIDDIDAFIVTICKRDFVTTSRGTSRPT